MNSMDDRVIPGTMPILALRGLAIFPKQTVHFEVGRLKSMKAVEQAMSDDRMILLLPQRDITMDDPTLSELYTVGTVAKIKQILKGQDNTLRVLAEGQYRARVFKLNQSEPFFVGQVSEIPDTVITDSPRNQALCRQAQMLYGRYSDVSEFPAQSVQLRIMSTNDPGLVADIIAQNSGLEYRDKAKLLANPHPVKRLEATLRLLSREIQIIGWEGDIQSRTHANIDQHQKEYFLREQMKVIQEELGEADEGAELAEYERRILLLNLGEESENKLRKDLERLRKQPFTSPEASVLRNYLDTVLDLPWNKKTKERISVDAASKVLEREHYGMEKVKERILETIAVRQMAPEMPPQILCLVGPPGVGKTSIAYSIARSLNRKLARISLGGVRDEADIRGHRKTYVGAMPGRIMTALGQAQSANALLLLDEIDKMGSDFRGDPSAALLEVLDAEQNKTYRDHYIEIPFDLSEVMFITTANSLDTVSRPLLDRMEIIELGSYTDEEKLMIGKNHLLPKQMEKHGLKKSQLKVTDDAIREIINCYTRESGVRNLERCFAQICRKADLKLIGEELPKKVQVTGSNVTDYLGVRKYLPERIPSSDQVGLVTGLAWTAVGGETLEVEVNVMDGTGKLELTGNLGDVMKESAHAALSYIRANAQKLGIQADFYKTKDIHVHFPAGAVPKDGPSAGVTVTTAIVSALTGIPVRRDVAMTGEVSLRGRVLPIGGLKEKTMAALRYGISTVIIPEDNRRDLEEIDPLVRRCLNFVTAKTVDTVLDVALKREGQMIPGILTDLPTDRSGKNRSNNICQ